LTHLKDFIVYPEYEESKDLEKIKVIVGELTIELEKRSKLQYY
jgi:hypothetical protein